MKSDRVPIAQKIGYGLGSVHDMWGHWLYPSLAYQVFNIYLGVSPALVARALFLNRLFDAASDPFFGWASDNTRTRYGRRRPFILVGAVLAGIGLPLLFSVRLFVPPGASETSYFWFMVVSSGLFIPVMSCFYMPYTSLGTELTPDYDERTSVYSYKQAIQKLPEMGLFFAAQFTTLPVWIGAGGSILAGLGRLLSWTHPAVLGANASANASKGEPDILLGAQVYCTILGFVMILCGIALFALTRERYYSKLAVHQTKIGIAETLYRSLKCRPFGALLVAVLGQCIGTSMVGTLGYYDTVYYVCHGDVAAGAIWNTSMGVAGMVFGLLALPVYGAVARRIGKIRAMRAVFVSAIAVFAATWWLYDPALPWLQPFASGLIAFTNAGFWMLQGSILADVMDFDELETGKRREGSFAACMSWIMKFGMALGVLASGEILARTGFDAKLGAAQSGHALFMIRVLLAVIPIAGYGVSLLAVSRLGLTPASMAEIRRQLEARRGTV
jgi:GPH family glycoside/pentoside/hexuronide:cation symporter